VWAATPTSTIWISPGVYPGAPSYTIWREGSNYFAKDAFGQIDYSGTNASDVIGDALAGLTAGRTWQEKVAIMGDITVTAPILVPSYVIIELDGKITLGNGINKAILKNEHWGSTPADREITIRGGIYDGNKANNPTDAPENGILAFHRVFNVWINKIHLINARSWSGIYLVGYGPESPNTKLWVTNSLIEETEGNYPYGYAIGVSAYPTQQIIISQNILLNNSGGILFEDSAGGAHIVNNDIRNCGISIRVIAGTGLLNGTVIEGNQIITDLSASYAIEVGSANNTVIDNNIVEGGSYGGIHLGNSNNSVVSNNVLTHNATSNGILLSGASFNNLIVNNIIHDYTNGVNEDGTSDYNLIMGIFAYETTNGILVSGTNTRVVNSWNGTVFVRFYNSTTLETG